MSQRGNILFLILIAVALFAALSFAITQSTRTSGGDSSRETAGLLAAQMIEDAADLRGYVTRAAVLGLSKTDMVFSEVGDATKPCSSGANCIFYQNGVFYPPPTPEVAAFADPAWAVPNYYYLNEVTVTNIGTSAPDVVFSYENITQAVCKEINRRLGLNAIPTISNPATIDINPPMPEGCYMETGGGTYGYFAVIIEN